MAMVRVLNRGSDCLEMSEKNLAVEAAGDTTCFDPRITLLRKYHRIFQRFPLAQLESYVKNQLTQPGTALLVTERTFPVIWKKFEDAMREDLGLRFSYNYLRAADSTIFVKQRARLLVVSAMPESYTRLVTDRVHNIMTAGIWEFWNTLSTRRMNESKFESVEIADFTPISMKHDGVYLLLLATGVMMGLSVASFFASVCFTVSLDSFAFEEAEI